ncbi:MAG: hypothetical protein ACI9KE_003061 [Polyangiales bacterium]|jgi:hypothetical protein
MTPSTHSRSRFYQARLARFGLVGSLVLLFGQALGLVTDILVDGTVTTHLVQFVGQAAAGLALFGMWTVLRSGTQKSERALEWLDIVTMNCVTIGFCVMSIGLPSPARPTMTLLLAMAFTFTMRSTYVPSSTRQTVFVHASAMIWLVLAAVRNSQSDPREGALTGHLITASVWWLFHSGAAASATSVIYGLRSKVTEAMQLGQYTLQTKLGHGGMGEVYRAKHALLRRPTAIKLLPPDRAGAQTIARFEREVQLTASLSHPNVVTVFDYGHTPDGIFYYAMEHLDGLDLEQLVTDHGPMEPARAVHVLVQICEGLAEAHRVGLIHRDIKPGNIFLVGTGRSADLVKVVDFGLVKHIEERTEVGLTGENQIVGTPQCMSPETISTPEEVDERSDIYGIGAVAYFILSGSHVFDGNTIIEVVAKHLQSEPAPLESEDVPKALGDLVLRCLAKAPSERPESASELARLLRQVEGIRPWLLEDARSWWGDVGSNEAPEVSPLDTTLAVDVFGRR